MKKFRIPQSRDQLSLLPGSIDEYVPPGDAVRYVDALVDEFDLRELECRFKFGGRPAYSPRVLIKVILYGKLRGIRSSRELARACRENMRFLFLAQREQPDFRTISDFRKNHIDVLGRLLKQTVEIGVKEGVIDLKQVAVDGSKIRANASSKSFQKPENLQKLLKALEQSLYEDVASDESEDDEHGDDDGDFKLPEKLQDRKELKDRIKETLRKYDSMPIEEKPKLLSKTDDDARFMKGPEGKRPCYNVQIGMDMKGRMVVGARVTNAGSDHGQLAPMVNEIKVTAGSHPKSITTDKGFRATEGIVALETNNIEGFIPVQASSNKRLAFEQFLYDEGEDEYICPEGRTLCFIGENRSLKADIYQSENCRGCSRQSHCLITPNSRRSLKVSQDIGALERMRLRMKTQAAKQMSRARSMTVELGFAWTKVHRKFRQLVFRGLEAVDREWKFEAVGLNVARLVSERMARTACQIA